VSVSDISSSVEGSQRIAVVIARGSTCNSFPSIRTRVCPSFLTSINRDLALLKHLFNFAIRDGCLEKNPVSLVKFEKENNARDRILSPEEFEQLQSQSALHLQAINLMAYQTGMRSGEILNLTWNRVDLKAGLVRLKAEDTKTDDARLVPLTADLTTLLKDLYKVLYL